MSASDGILLRHWTTRRDARAFQELVLRHGAMVYGACYRIVRNAADAEEVTQECFLALAQSEGKRIRTVGGWLHTLATRRSLDRLRTDTRRREREERYARNETRVAAEPSWDDVQQFVDEAIASLPDELSAAVVGHFLEGRTQTELADEAGVSSTTIARRIDRGIEGIREQLASRGIPIAFAALPGMLHSASATTFPNEVAAALGRLALSGTSGALGNAPRKTSVPVTSSKAALGSLAAAAIAVIALLTYEFVAPDTPRGSSTSMGTENEEADSRSNSGQGETTTSDVAESPSAGVDAPERASISGVVVFRGAGRPADNMRVLLATESHAARATITNLDGSFRFADVPAGEAALVAYDARYDELPEDDFRSEHIPVQLTDGEALTGVEIDVPPRGGEVFGTIVDKATGEGLAGIRIEAIQFGNSSRTATSDGAGHYRIIGLDDGEWRLTLDRQNPVLTSPLLESMPAIHIEDESVEKLDVEIDRSVSIHGVVTDEDGNPVANAWVHAKQSVGDRIGSMSCYTRTDANGKFTFWSAHVGNRMALSARYEDYGSKTQVVRPTDGRYPSDVELALLPRTKVAGRFIDRNGKPAAAVFWLRPVDGEEFGFWSGLSVDASTRFEEDLAPGEYEVQGVFDGHSFDQRDADPMRIRVGSEPVSGLTVTVDVVDSSIGPYRLSGSVTDELGDPLPGVRVYIDGRRLNMPGAFQETRTDRNGAFTFDNLRDAPHTVNATPSDPFEPFAGSRNMNPAETSTVSIVVRKSGRLRGKVVDAKSGEPISDFKAEIGSVAWNGHEQLWENRMVASSTGEFDVPARLDENWYLAIRADGFAEERIAGAALRSGEIVSDLDFRLDKGRVVRGHVRTEAGEPVANALVYHDEEVFDHGRRGPRFASATTDSVGDFVLESLPASAERIYVQKDGFSIAEREISPNLEVVLAKGGTISGAVSIGNGPLPANTSVTAFFVDRSAVATGVPVEEDRYELTGLMDGGYRLMVTVRDESMAYVESYRFDDVVEAVNGETTTYDMVVILGEAAIEGNVVAVNVPAFLQTLRCDRAGYFTYLNPDENGAFRVDHLPAGPVRIEWHVRDGSGGWTPVTLLDTTIGSGERRVVELDLPAVK